MDAVSGWLFGLEVWNPEGLLREAVPFTALRSPFISTAGSSVSSCPVPFLLLTNARLPLQRGTRCPVMTEHLLCARPCALCATSLLLTDIGKGSLRSVQFEMLGILPRIAASGRQSPGVKPARDWKAVLFPDLLSLINTGRAPSPSEKPSLGTPTFHTTA